MALRFLMQTITPVERMAISLCFRPCAGLKTASTGSPQAERPKKPHTGYVQFVTDTIPKLKLEMPGAKSTEVLIKASSMWKMLDPATRKQYNDHYAASKEKWQAEMAHFEASLSAQARDKMLRTEREAREQRKEGREKRQKRRVLAEHQKPKRPANAFMLFMLEKQGLKGDRSQKEFVVAMAREWAVKPDSEKEPFVKRYMEAKDKYQKELAAWEKKMIKQGRSDLVRTGSQPIIDLDEVPVSRR